MIANLIKMIIEFIKMPLIVIASLVVIYYILVAIQEIKWKRKGLVVEKRFKANNVHKEGLMYRFLYALPQMRAYDVMKRNVNEFRPKGVVIFTGRQGNGKTIAMTQYARQLKRRYPLSKCITNFDFKMQNDELSHWKQLLDYNNGIYGVIVGMDETQNWFSSNQSKNFPPEMLSVITQNRKNHRIILGTAQNFYLLSKALRSQCTEVRECKTFFGCLTLVHKKEPILNDKGDVVEWHKCGYYFFVHDIPLRECYDTWKVIESLAKSGFKENQELLKYLEEADTKN